MTCPYARGSGPSLNLLRALRADNRALRDATLQMPASACPATYIIFPATVAILTLLEGSGLLFKRICVDMVCVGYVGMEMMDTGLQCMLRVAEFRYIFKLSFSFGGYYIMFNPRNDIFDNLGDLIRGRGTGAGGSTGGTIPTTRMTYKLLVYFLDARTDNVNPALTHFFIIIITIFFLFFVVFSFLQSLRS